MLLCESGRCSWDEPTVDTAFTTKLTKQHLTHRKKKRFFTCPTIQKLHQLLNIPSSCTSACHILILYPFPPFPYQNKATFALASPPPFAIFDDGSRNGGMYVFNPYRNHMYVCVFHAEVIPYILSFVLFSIFAET